MELDTCPTHIYTELIDGLCPTCSITNTSQSKFQYLVERLYSTSFKAGLTPEDEIRKAKREEAYLELIALKPLFKP